MSGTRHARMALVRALSVACVVLLCLWGAGPATAAAAAERPASTAPGEPGFPAEGESDPAAEPEARPVVRPAVRGAPGVRQLPQPVFHVKHADQPGTGASCGPAGPTPSTGTVRSVVLRC
ncbi:hypothetical protein ABZ128_29195 [Streptomyces sp. NPDC006326]|uniref:hypothetical protein n=1 Tax=Streptomyces sp. NPDC006326 TaxID=3156752 RepID=UPI0033A3493A